MRFGSRTQQTLPIFFLTTAAVLSFRPLSTTQADSSSTLPPPGRTTQQQQQQQQSQSKPKPDTRRRRDKKNCPYYGCPLFPHDVHYNDPEIKQALESMRRTKRQTVDAEALDTLQKSAAADASAVTLTLIGYKGGKVRDQINQDRAVVVQPYYITKEQQDGDDETTTATTKQTQKRRATTNQPQTASSSSSSCSSCSSSILEQDRVLLGVFDGHAPLGELVSEFTATELPKLLAAKLQVALQDFGLDMQENDNDTDDNDDDDSMRSDSSSSSKSSSSTSPEEEQVMQLTTRALTETFVQLDQTAPADRSGGCTATVVLKQGGKIYVANAGDSRSFVVTYRPSTGLSEIVYMTREDKPDLPDEKARVEAAGGQVYIPARGTSRVVYHDPNSGSPTGLAMSRSIGDWAAGKIGVIPNPIVHVLDIDTLVTTQLYGLDNGKNDRGTAATAAVDANGNVDSTMSSSSNVHDDVYIFAVSATDGMMDYLHEAEISNILSHALFAETGIHPVSACEHLVFAAAQGWQEAKQGRYRDDIAIAVSALRRPPAAAATTEAEAAKQ